MKILNLFIAATLIGQFAYAQKMCSILFENKSAANIYDIFPKLKPKKQQALRDSQIEFLNDFLKNNESEIDKSKIVAVLLIAINDPKQLPLKYFNTLSIDMVNKKNLGYAHEISPSQEKALIDSLSAVIQNYRKQQIILDNTINNMTKILTDITEKGKFTISEQGFLLKNVDVLIEKANYLTTESKLRSHIMNNTQFSHILSARLNQMTRQLDLANATLSPKDKALFEEIYNSISEVYLRTYIEL